jgi:hypothetical protein
MVVSRDEYGGLYYPTSIYVRKPYELAPDVAWMLNAEASAKGRRRLQQRLGGRNLELIRWVCAADSREGRNRFLTDCTVSYTTDAGPVEKRQLFAAIMERDGQYKFLSLAGDF